MKKKVSKFFIVIIFLAGLSLLLYPFVANQWNNHRQKQLISSYEDNLTQLTEAGDIDYATTHWYRVSCRIPLQWQMPERKKTVPI